MIDNCHCARRNCGIDKVETIEFDEGRPIDTENTQVWLKYGCHEVTMHPTETN